MCGYPHTCRLDLEEPVLSQKIKQGISIGGNLRRLRLQAGLTQEQVAAKMQLEGINVSRDFYAHIENGTYNIRISELAALKKIFETDYNALFKGV